MLKLFINYRNLRRLAMAAALVPPLLIAGIVITAAKSPVYIYADPLRLAETAAVFAIAATALPLWAAARRRAADARIAFQYHGASGAIRNTARFLSDERRSATRRVVPAVVTAIGSAGFYTISAWPQLAGVHPCRPLFGMLAVGSPILAGLALHGQRKHLINAIYLKHYLRQATRHIGFQPPSARASKRLAAELAKPAVTCATASGFRAGGFDWQIDDFWKSTIVFGQPGSGKTVCVLNALLEGLFATSKASTLPAAGLILDSKGDFRGKIDRVARRYSRQNDIVILSAADWPQHGDTMRAIRWSPLDCPDDGLEIAARLITAAKLAGGVKAQESFFIDAARSFLRHSIEFIRAGQAGAPPSMIDLRRLATEFNDENGYYIAISKAVLARHGGGAIPAAVNDAVSYFEGEYRKMPDRQRGGLVGTITQLIDEFSNSPFREMMSGRSTITIPEIIDQGKILYVDLPTAERPRMAMLVSCLIKLEFQREILRRVDKERTSFFFCDEFPVLWTSGEGRGDSDFFSLSRASRHANIVAAQNISSFYKKSDNKDDARNFLGNCAVKIFLRNTETETNAWASKLFGTRSEIVVTTNESASLNDGLKRAITSYSRSTATMPVVPPEAFSTLAVPVRDDRTSQYTESIVHLATRATTQKLDLAWRVHPI